MISLDKSEIPQHLLEYFKPRHVIKPKDDVMIPQRVALALQADGWYVRSLIVWAKGLSFCPTYSGSVMPESCRDRPTSAYEHVFLLSKNKRYFYDGDAVREKVGEPTRRAASFRNEGPYTGNRSFDNSADNAKLTHGDGALSTSGRNLRNVWTINPAGFPGSHFATFPPKLIEPMIKAGTSERGCCPSCGAGWVRVVEKESFTRDQLPVSHPDHRPREYVYKQKGHYAPMASVHTTSNTLGWTQTCDCPPHEPVPCTVLDPFFGAGTTGLVSRALGRDCIGIELNPDYCEMARRRLDGIEEIEVTDVDGVTFRMEQTTMFSSVAVE